MTVGFWPNQQNFVSHAFNGTGTVKFDSNDGAATHPATLEDHYVAIHREALDRSVHVSHVCT